MINQDEKHVNSLDPGLSSEIQSTDMLKTSKMTQKCLLCSQISSVDDRNYFTKKTQITFSNQILVLTEFVLKGTQGT